MLLQKYKNFYNNILFYTWKSLVSNKNAYDELNRLITASGKAKSASSRATVIWRALNITIFGGSFSVSSNYFMCLSE